ncbi:vitamin K epoxide reductase family protein [Granulicella cerasi]|uniref:Vitamin K epoxide reductase family protein n=1 Tax=Granulicella cerasi TaxID=741063 RepID=A0ABW1ZDF5_9BACT|nr:vitamin K epoxide reductase family protein [Granulicella cerasi]
MTALRFLRFLVALIALGGMVDSFLALRIHKQDPSMAPPCAVSEKWDCGSVNHSRYAVFPAQSLEEDPATSKAVHVPVATLGIIGYAAIAVLALFAPFWLTLQVAEIGFGGAAVLSYLEAFVIQKWCIYCVWSQSLIAAIVALCLVGTWMQWRMRKRFVVA